MADGLTCDRCGKNLLVGEDVRYVVRVEVFAAYDPLEISPDDLARDTHREAGELLERMKGMTEQEAMDSVYRKLSFDLCPACQKAYLRDPLTGGHLS